MKRIFASLSLVLGCLAAQAQTFPDLSGTTLNSKLVTIPQATKGKFSIIGLVYSAKAKETLGPWIQNVYDYFMMDPDYDLNVYFVPMIGGLKEVAAGTVEKQMQKGVPPELHGNVMIYKGDLGNYKKTLGMDQKDIPYIFLLDKQGKIIYKTSGPYTDAKLEKMDELVDESDE